MNLFDDLEYRGLINQSSDEEGLKKILAEKKITLYLGFDPTAESLHIGSLVGILMLRRFQLAGHTVIPLVGGATGLIGDPKPSAERTLNSREVVAGFTDKIKKQLAKFLNFESGENRAILENNYDWTKNLDVITFLRDIGKNFNVNYMLAKDVVSSRLETGISYSEFSYMILQANDYLNLYRKHNCRLQLGGSDQWGNITAGHELIRKTEPSAKVFAMTFPLVTKADGTKFGKTEGGTIWLDESLTSAYEFYQFWYNTDDRDVIKYMKYYSFLEKEEIEKFADLVAKQPEKREAQKTLAAELTELVHGKVALEKALKISAALFSGDVSSLTSAEIKIGFKDVLTAEVSKVNSLIDILVMANICQSKRQAREDVTNGAIYVKGSRQIDCTYVLTENDKFDNQFTIIRKGKKKYFMVKFN